MTADPDSSSNVRTWKAVLSLFGFGDGKAFIHYLNPNGVLKKTVRLGRLRGPCGRLKTGERRVMPFENPQFGVWRLQFDTRRRYDRDTENKTRDPGPRLPRLVRPRGGLPSRHERTASRTSS